ncbi:MAG: hypothetical protein CSA29_02110 [Desulfobacterales bacterium]|nr:MAG: hypothetical protein CSA29_02110 [Desulfobacterales bacterium]
MKTKILAILIGTFLVAGNAFAITYTFEDTVVNWPDYNVNSADQMGSPDVGGMTVTVNDNTNILETVTLSIQDRLYYDSLFINSYNTTTTPSKMNDWDDWDYYIRDDDSGTGLQNEGMYRVNDGYSYTLVQSNGRIGHPNGIDMGSLTLMNSSLNGIVSYDGSTLVYDLSGINIDVSNGFTIGYTPYCANDVMLASSAPEPGTLFLLGMSLIGVSAYCRKK